MTRPTRMVRAPRRLLLIRRTPSPIRATRVAPQRRTSAELIPRVLRFSELALALPAAHEAEGEKGEKGESDDSSDYAACDGSDVGLSSAGAVLSAAAAVSRAIRAASAARVASGGARRVGEGRAIAAGC